MGSHAKPRTPGRKTAIGALALGATLTGVGLTAAALDPATAVLTASGTEDGGSTQLSGLSNPVGMSLSPAADDITNLTAAPFGTGGIAVLTNAVNGTASGALGSAGTVVGTATSGTLDVSTQAPATTTTRQDAIKPIAASALTASHPVAATGTGSNTGTGSSAGSSSAVAPATTSATTSGGYTGKHARPRSAPSPAATAPLASTAAAGLASSAGALLPLAQGLLGNVPVVSTLVQGAGVTGTASGLLGTASGTVGGTVSGASGDPAGGVVGSLPLVGTLLGGSGDGRSTLTVPNVSALAGSLGGLV
jgi:hypothetical protein